MFSLRRLAFIIPLAAACSLSEQVQTPPVDITTETSPSDVKLGDTAHVSIELVNVSDQVVWIGPSGCNNDFVILNSAGKVYRPAETIYCILAMMPPVELSPGETYAIEAFTTGRAIAEGSQDAPGLVPPGTYDIRAVMAILRGDEDALVVRSSPSTITFRAN
jgi:hypothetical protein